MDIYSTEGLDREWIAKHVELNEKAHPNLKRENEQIRELLKRDDVMKAINNDGIDVDAAMISSCRLDILRCGRCRFWACLNRHGIRIER